MLAVHVEVVIGVDTHKHTHTDAVVATETGAVVAQLTLSTDPEGYEALIDLADEHGALRVGGWKAPAATRRTGRPSHRARSW